jgi:hypothetical protein
LKALGVSVATVRQARLLPDAKAIARRPAIEGGPSKIWQDSGPSELNQ